MAKSKQDPAILLFVGVGICVVGALGALGIVSMKGDDRYESATLAGIYYGLFGGVGGVVGWAIYRRFRPWQ